MQITDTIQVFNETFIVASEPYHHPKLNLTVFDAVDTATGEKWEISLEVFQMFGSVLSAS